MVPYHANVVTVCLVLHQCIGRLGFERAPYLVTLVPTNSDVVGFAEVFADVVFGFASVRAHAAVGVLKRAAVPDHVEIVHVRLVPPKNAACGRAKGAALTLEFSWTLGNSLGRRQDRARDVAVGKVFV
jgi:hypothetical protein